MKKRSKRIMCWDTIAKKVSSDPKMYTEDTIELVAKINLYTALYGAEGMAGLLFMMREL